MTAFLSRTIRIASPSRAHVSDSRRARATHVFDPAYALADRPTLRYTLAGSPNGEPAGGGSAPCG
jgi:hypothetical protein